MGFTVLNQVEYSDMGFKQKNLKRVDVLIELIELNTALSAKDIVPNYTNKTRMKGFFKIGFLVSDFDKWMTHLTLAEMNFHGNVVADEISGKRMVIIKDLDGNRIQIFEK